MINETQGLNSDMAVKSTNPRDCDVLDCENSAHVGITVGVQDINVCVNHAAIHDFRARGLQAGDLRKVVAHE